MGYFLPFHPVTAQKMILSKKWKESVKIWFYTIVPKIMIICYTAPEIWYMTDVIVTFHFRLFFAFLHKCTKNHDHTLCCSWDMACDRCNFYFSFWAIFCPFTTISAKKKWKKTPGDIIILHNCTRNHDHMPYRKYIKKK